MANTDVLSSASQTLRSPVIKFLAIAGLTVAMAIPLFFIQLALSDRESRAAGAIDEVANGWGRAQTVAGPVLLLPYTVTVTRHEMTLGTDTQTVEHRTAVILPENLDVKVDAAEQTRRRGIFQVPVYRAGIRMHATFDRAALAGIEQGGAQIQWGDASILVLVSDPHGLADNVAMTLKDKSIPFQPGGGVTGGNFSGIQAPLSLTGADDLAIDTNFALRGSRELSFTPLGRRTTASFQSSWHSPSFFGAFLPSDRKVTPEGFTASWVVPYLARGFGQNFSTTEGLGSVFAGAASGVKFYQPVDHYQLVERSIKYAIMFIALAFLVFFVVETVSPQRLHAVQYALVGAAQALFYLLLLSFSEHIGFALAYLVASAATIVLTSAYAISALADKLRAGVLCAILSALYALLYVILNAEDYALLIGSGLLFAALAATMFVTRKIDWYRAGEPQIA